VGSRTGRALSSRSAPREWSLTSPVAPRVAPSKSPMHREEPESLPPSPRQRGRFSRSEMPSTDECCLDALARDPFPELVDSPPPLPPLCHGRLGFRCAFTPAALSRRGARPFVVFQTLFTPGRERPRIARRLLQPMRSASTTTDVRTPQHRTRSRPLVQLSSRSAPPFGDVSSCGWHALLSQCRPAEMSRARGCKPKRNASPAAPPTATARGENFAPTRSARAPHVARS
jgi:hypothetical protein